jgi:hypothetical protein
MLGRHAGIERHLVEKYLNLIVWHCSNHRFEIAVNDVVREISTVFHMKTFLTNCKSFTVNLPKIKPSCNRLHTVKY